MMKLLKVYMGEKDRHAGIPLHEHILRRCYELGISGATVTKGMIGYGKKRHIHRSDFFSLSGDLPITVEVVDDPEKLKPLIEEIKDLQFDGLLTLSDVEGFYISNGEKRSKNS